MKYISLAILILTPGMIVYHLVLWWQGDGRSNLAWLALWLFVIGPINGASYYLRAYYPNGLTPDSHGIIHHPFYGDYPAVVPFHQGMDLLPGQSAEGFIEVPQNGHGI